MPTVTLAASAGAVVLDTNVVLDWLWFRDPSMADFSAALAGRGLFCIGTPAMRQELAHVLEQRPPAWGRAGAADVLAAWDAGVRLLAEPVPTAPLRCRDPDDQMFIDLALAQRAHRLLTRDRALLALAKRARGLGLDITTPDHFFAERTPA